MVNGLRTLLRFPPSLGGFWPSARVTLDPSGDVNCNRVALPRKSGPISGATFSKEAVGKELGKAIQQANPPVGLAQERCREQKVKVISSAASFIELILKHLPRQRIWPAAPAMAFMPSY
jgi:hypothetical protein